MADIIIGGHPYRTNIPDWVLEIEIRKAKSKVRSMRRTRKYRRNNLQIQIINY